MKYIKQEEMIKETGENYPILQVITGGKDTNGGPWLLNLPVGQWFISEFKGQRQLWNLKFKFKKSFLLFTNLNMDYKEIVDPIKFSKDHLLVELLDVEE